MSWLGLIVGVVVGGLIGKFPGALALGFLGWLVGFIISSQKKQSVIPVQTGIQRPERSVADRLDALERRLATLEKIVIPAKAGIQDTAQPPMVATPREETPIEPIAEPVRPVSGSLDLSGADMSRTGEFGIAPPTPEAGTDRPTAGVALVSTGAEKSNPFIAWLFGGNTIVRVGLLVLFLGLAFLVKYGVEHQLIPVELRVAAVGAAGLALLIVGWRLRRKRAGYALSLQGAGVAVLYLTIFGSMKLYGLIPPAGAFGALVAIAALSAFLAVKQDSIVFAIFAAAGGFMAPILASTGQGSHVMLFSYYLLLNASIIAIAWFKAWRPLNLVGFLFTVLIGNAWGLRSYNSDLFDSTEPFLIAFFLMYVAIAILFARKVEEGSQRAVDGTLVFGAPIFAFGLQAGMMKGIEFGLAFSSVAMAALYLLLASFLRRQESSDPSGASGSRFHLISECFLALGVVFATLAIPLALDARWTSAAWALEGAAIVWVGLRQKRKLARAFGLLLEIGAGMAFIDAWRGMPSGPPLADAVFVGAVILGVTGIWTHRLLKRPEADTGPEHALMPLAFIWGLAWLLIAGGHEIETFVSPANRPAAWIAFLAAVPLVFGLAAMRWDLREARWPTYVLAPVLLFATAAMTAARANPFGDFRWLAWTFAIAANFFLLARVGLNRDWKWTAILHVLSVALVALVGSLELEWVAADHTARGAAWALASRLVVPSLLIFWISSRAMDTRWPVRDFTAVYRIGAVGALLGAMALWSLHVNLSHAGGSEPLPYIPVLNALDLGHILAILAVVAAVVAARRSHLAPPAFFTPRVAGIAAGVLGFVWANSMLLRTIHHWAGVAYRPYTLWHSVLVQASLSVFWSFLALALMVYATRRAWRGLWMLGAALMAVVVVKLVLIDLGHLAGIERIVSFIGVGVLMLVIGYFSPVPPRKAEAA